MTFDENQEEELHKLLLITIEQTHRLTKAGVLLAEIKKTVIDALVSVTDAHK